MSARLAFLAALGAALLAGCASGPPLSSVGAGSPPLEAPLAPAPPAEEPPALPADAVERAEQPFVAVRSADGVGFPVEAFADELSTADLVCLGERHDAAVDHATQWRLLEELVDRAQVSGRQPGLGLEMVERSRQKTLDAWTAAGEDVEGLALRLNWKKSWGFDFALYRPVLASAAARRLPFVALNADREVARQIARGGLPSLAVPAQNALPELDLDVATHRAAFDAAMVGHPGFGKAGVSAGESDRWYAAQTVRDETMAETAALWLERHAPAAQLVILAGGAHCRRDAVPERAARRGVAHAVSVLLVDSDAVDSDAVRAARPSADWVVALGATQ